MTSVLLESRPLRILVVDDEPAMVGAVSALVGSAGHQVVTAYDGDTALRRLSEESPDLILLDLAMPGRDGVDVCREVRRTSTVPIIVLTGETDELAKVAALDAGADDYLTKPFGVGELLARLRVALRHSTQADGEPIFTVGGLRVDFEHRRVFVDDSEVHLTPTEYKLLTTLIRHAGKVLTHRQLLKEVWGPNAIEHTHYLRVYMTQLRHKLEADAARPRYLLTEPGVGYRLQAE
jgi:two-component system KDP operon response regulator KdpE